MSRPSSFAYFTAQNDAFALPDDTLLFDVNVGTGTASAVLTIYNGTSSSDPVIALIDASARGTYHFGGIRCSRGLYAIMTTAAAKITLTYG